MPFIEIVLVFAEKNLWFFPQIQAKEGGRLGKSS